MTIEHAAAGKFYEDLSVGQTFRSASRTVTEADVVQFAAFTSDMHPLHTDAEYCRGTRYGQRIAHGFLIASLASGLSYRLRHTEGTVAANLGTTWKFQKPVFIDDTIHVEISIKEMRPSKSDPGTGIVVRQYDVVNQRGELCAVGEVAALFIRRTA